MNADELRLAEALFARLADCPADEREARIHAECPSNPELRRCVLRLLASDAALDPRFLTGSYLSVHAWDDSPAANVRRVGPYRVIGLVGEGGMGVVYEAEQEHPRRLVALKVIRPERMSRATLSRFEYEVEVLGRLQHPGIAQIYEASTADMELESGVILRVPFFAMERVHGRPLSDSLAAGTLDVKARLELFARICDAVGYAHQQGVIHRDLKPANILVVDANQDQADGDTDSNKASPRPPRTPTDAPSPKILDFGIAKTLGVDFETLTLTTSTGQILGTVPYMSPEQLGGDARQLDTRADVYSLGVILFQLLRGELPHPPGDLGWAQLARDICEREAPPLSTRTRRFAADLNVICARSLAKDKAQRYASAVELAADVRRHLRDEPILARAHSTSYVVSRMIRRHRAAAALATVLCVTLIASAVSFGLLYRAQSIQRRRAEEEGAKARTVVSILQQMLGTADPMEGMGHGYTVIQMLDDFVARRLGEWPTQPEIEATIRETIGIAYRGLNALDKAGEQLEQALALRRTRLSGDQPAIARVLAELSRVRYLEARYPLAESLANEAWNIRTRELGELSVESADSLDQIASLHQHSIEYDQAQTLYEKALRVRKELLGPRHPDVAQTLENLALLQQHRGDFAAAEPFYREALSIRLETLGENHADVADALFNLASLRQGRGDYVEAESLYRRALAINEHVFGHDHPLVAWSQTGLANLLRLTQRFEEAERRYRDAVVIWSRSAESPNPAMAVTLSNLGLVLMDLGRYAEAESACEKAVALQRRYFGDAQPNTGVFLVNLASAVREQTRYDEAQSYLDQATWILYQFGEVDPRRMTTLMLSLARLARDRGDYRTSSILFEDAVERSRYEWGARHPATLRAECEWIDVLDESGRPGEALDVALTALEAADDTLATLHPLRAEIRAALCRLLLERGLAQDLPMIHEHLSEAICINAEVLPPQHWSIAEVNLLYGTWQAHAGQPSEGAARRHAALERLRNALGSEHWRVVRATRAE